MHFLFNKSCHSATGNNKCIESYDQRKGERISAIKQYEHNLPKYMEYYNAELSIYSDMKARPAFRFLKEASIHAKQRAKLLENLRYTVTFGIKNIDRFCNS